METRIIQATQAQKVIRKILSGNFLDIELGSDNYQLVHITISNLIGERKISSWEEVFTGNNHITVDISRLMRGMYMLTINYASQLKKEEMFSIG